MNENLIKSLIESGFIKIYIEIKSTGILNTYSKNLSICKKRKIGNLSYNADFLEYDLKQITNKMIEDCIFIKTIKLKELIK